MGLCFYSLDGGPQNASAVSTRAVQFERELRVQFKNMYYYYLFKGQCCMILEKIRIAIFSLIKIVI